MTLQQHNITVPTRLLNTPLMATVEEINTIISALSGNFSLADIKALFTQADRSDMSAGNSVAVIPITGGLTYRGYGWYWGMTYNDIRQAFRRALADPEITAVVLDVDSPGGEVAGCFDLCDEIYNARGQKPIYAVANERCFSAAYAIASAADKVFLSRTAGVGSIGVIAVHAEQSKYDEKIGVTYTPIFAGEQKNDFSAHHPLSESALKTAQASVNRTYALFCQTVARNRDMSEDSVRDTHAGIFEGESAVEAGLADQVLSWSQAMDQIFSENTNQGEQNMSLAQITAGLSAALADDAQKEGVVQILGWLGFVPKDKQQAAGPENQTALETATQTGRAAGVEEMRQTALEIMDVCRLAEMPEMAADLIRKGASPEEAKKKATNAKAAEADGWRINSSTSPTGNGGQNPLVADAQQRAEA